MTDDELKHSREAGIGDDPEDVRRLRLGEREFILIGTAHVSKQSADLVREVIDRERPDHVCVELDEQRFQALSQKTRWESLDLRQVIRRRQLATLLMNLLLSSYQKKIGDKLGVMPGTELLEAVRAAEEAGIPYSLSDRSVRTTLLRAWRSMSLWQRAKMFAGLMSGIFSGADISEEQLAELRKKDVLSEVMAELASVMPTLKEVLIDERDTYLAEKIRVAEGDRVVAVVGAGHVEGILQALSSGVETDLTPISEIPPASQTMRWVGWSIPVVIVGLLTLVAVTKGQDVAGESLRFWILVNGIPAGIGALIALAHPLTIAVAFLAAPITSLTPVIGAGYVTAFVQAWIRPPLVRDFHNLSEDAGSVPRWWKNRLLRVLLAFVFPTLGSIIGTYAGLAEILSKLF